MGSYPRVKYVLTPRMSQIFLGEIIKFYRKWVSDVDMVVNFNDFSRPNKKIKYFSRTLTKLKDFSR